MTEVVIGGTGFIGAPLVRQLARMGHTVTLFHRGSTQADLPAEHILGYRRDLKALRPKTDVVIDLILSTGAQATSLMEAFRGFAQRVLHEGCRSLCSSCS